MKGEEIAMPTPKYGWKPHGRNEKLRITDDLYYHPILLSWPGKTYRRYLDSMTLDEWLYYTWSRTTSVLISTLSWA